MTFGVKAAESALFGRKYGAKTVAVPSSLSSTTTTMPTNQYELVPNDITSETTSLTGSESDVDDDEEGSQSPVTAHRNRIARAESQLRRDPRFNQPPPSALKRAGLVVFIIFLFWLTFQVRKLRAAPKSNVVHATR